jgi:hypothetical protein
LNVSQYENLSVFDRQGCNRPFERFLQLLSLKCLGRNLAPVGKILREILAFLIGSLFVNGLVQMTAISS